jgi:NTE family protein
MEKHDLGLVLSGGGARGFAHLGVYEAIKELGLKPAIIGGVSAGSIIGAFIADGKSPAEAFEILTSKSLFNFVKIAFPRKGFVRMDAFEKMLRTELNAKNIENLSIPLKIFATNLNTAELEAFDKGDLVDAIIASSSIPVIFEPRLINKQLYLDGGLINNFPADILREHCKTLIGVNLNPLGYAEDINNLKKIAERCFHIFVRNHASSKMDICDYYIEPPELDKISILNTSHAQEIFDYGYKEAMKVLKVKS